MVSVPVTPGRSVQVQALPEERFRYAEARNYIGPAIQQAGDNLSRVAAGWDQMEATYDEAAVKKIAVAVDDRKRQLLYTGDDPFFSKQGFDASTAREGVEKSFAEMRDEALSQAQNKRQRGMLTDALNKSFGASLEDVAKYATGQLNVEWVKQTDARLSGFQQDAVRLYSDPERYADNIAGGLAEIQSLADRQGWSEDRVDETEERFVSGVHTAVINGRLTADDLDGALALFTKYRDDLSYNDAQAIETKLQPAIQFRKADERALVALGSVPTSGPDDAPTPGVAADLYGQLQAIESNESGGRHFDKSGRPLTSSAGAVGVMQVMPATGPEAARYAGLAWDAERFRTDADYNRALGQAYYKEMLRRFGGDPVKAAAAYNAGPGSAAKGTGVNGALAKARKAGEPDNWVAYLPAETRDYVAKFQKKTGAAASGNSEARKWDLSAAYTELEDRAKREGWTPEDLERARQRVDEYVKRDEMLAGRREADEFDKALSTADALGDSFTDISQISNFSKLSPERQHTLRNMADANKRAVLTAQAPKANSDLAIGLENMAIEDPEKFLQQDLRIIRSQVTPDEYASLQNKAATIRAKPQQEIAFRGAISGTITMFATPEMNLDGKQNADRKRKVMSIMETYLRGHVKEGAQPTQSQLNEAMRFATGSVQTPRGGIAGALGFGAKKTPRTDLPAFDVPSDIFNAYVRGYRAEHGGRSPTDQEIETWWNKNKGNYQ
ncbi:hypothetical protein CVO77_00215 [Sphingopyxis lindanitolerans]|uniref:Transglycosylase SLT domain-containing protein n=1 Tax=Sphingopyxis lindanitolerans TaxID=2054227 RepID=A0A2S8BAZ1_9SPHN|nr:transglycosylase SLT domain-containing protein [Sphingopyxis lindanitolerans]PQM29399.1 hypothetical protein CVO77_00215 [Sphingopyxis lindanitolerans]